MKSYEKALEAQAHAVGVLRTKAIDFIDAYEYAPTSARNELKTSESLFRGKTYREYLEGLNDESND